METLLTKQKLIRILLVAINISCAISAIHDNTPNIEFSTLSGGSDHSPMIQKSIGGDIILNKRFNDWAAPLYFNAENDISQPSIPIEKNQSNTDELYYNSANNSMDNNNKTSNEPSSLTQTAVPKANLRKEGSIPTGAPTTGKDVIAPTVDVISSTTNNNKNIIKENKKSFINYEKPSKIKPHDTVLHNGRKFPMIGVGAGNIPRAKIPLMINQAMYSVRLVDTSKAQSNESLVARAILRWLKAQPQVKVFDPSQHVIHIVTKVWYTHLGYERTSLSVRESLNDLSSILSGAKNIGYQIKVHAIIQYPRCYDEIEWMRCQEEEMELDVRTKSVGPDPNLDPENAFKGSWKALEQLYKEDLLESIGVSNFKLNDMEELLDMCTVKPHLYQGNLYNVILDTNLMGLLKENKIFFQTYNVINDTYGRKALSPRSFAALQRIGLNYAVDDIPGGFSGAQVILSWLNQHGYGAVPGSSQEAHLIENFPQYILKIPNFANLHDIDVHTSLVSLLKGIDASEYNFSGINTTKGVVVTFYNAFSSAVKIFAVKNGREIAASIWMETGKSNRVIASTNDVFVAYGAHGTAIKRFRIEKGDGMEETLTVEI